MNHILFAVATLANLISPAPKPFPVQFAQSVTGRTVTVCIDGRKVETTFAGKLGFRDQNSSWTSVCADVRSPISNGQFFYVRALSSSQFGGNVAKAGNIVAKYFKSARTDDQCAGLQIAVWEALEDGGDQPNFLAGRFQVRSSQAALAFAEMYYQAIEEPGDAVYLQTGGQGGGGGQGQFSVT